MVVANKQARNQYRFSRYQRLDNPGFLKIISSRFRHREGILQTQVLQHVKPLPNGGRLGLIVPKRHLRRAIDRNRFRRIIRETFRTHPLRQSAIDVVVAIHQTFIIKGQLEKRQLAVAANQAFDKILAQIVKNEKS